MRAQCRSHRLGALHRGHRRGALRRTLSSRTTRATRTATASCSRRGMRPRPLRGALSPRLADARRACTYCQDGTRLGTHPEAGVAGIDFATGSLGQGLSLAAGAALAGRLQGSSGGRSASSAMRSATRDRSGRPSCSPPTTACRISSPIVDLNGQQALGYTKDVLDLSPMADRWRAFGWDVHEVDGHDPVALARTISQARHDGRAARTCSSPTRSSARASPSWRADRVALPPDDRGAVSSAAHEGGGGMRATFIRTLVELAEEDERIVLLTGDLGFTVVEPFAERFPDRFFNVGVAEQNMVGVATGLAEAGFVPFVYSIATFATLRPYEFIRNGPVLHHLPVRDRRRRRRLRVRARTGVTHYALEDIAVMRAQPGMTVLVPADSDQARTARARDSRQSRARSISGSARASDASAGPRRALRARTARADRRRARTSCSSPRARSRTRRWRPSTLLSRGRRCAATVVVVVALNPGPTEELAAVLRQASLARHRRGALRQGASARYVSEVVAERASGAGSCAAASVRTSDVVGTRGVLATRTACRRRRSPRRRGGTAASTGPRTEPRRPDEEAQRDHRLLPGRARGPDHARAADRDLPVESGSTTRSSSSTTRAPTTRARCSPSSPRRIRTSSSSTTRGTSAPRARSRAACASRPGMPSMLLDGDLQDPPELIADFYEKWREGYDVVYGERVKREAHAADADRVQALLSPVPAPRRTCRSRSTPATSRCSTGGWSTRSTRCRSRDRFMRGLRAWVGFRQTGVPYVRPERPFGTSTNSLLAEHRLGARRRSSRSRTRRSI